MQRTLSEWLAWQETLHPHAIDMGLERVRTVAGRLEAGHFACPVVVVGGTNGKGSCVAMLEAMLAAGGYRVGTFTSPHLVLYNERIRIAGRLASDAELVAAFERIDAARGDISLTFFEFNTLAALLLFKEAGLDALVLEVGLGGRLDAVNLVDADVSLLTTVGLDHCDWLGPTLEDIGREKAGIFRAGRTAVLGSERMPRSVHDGARAMGARVRVADPALMQGLPVPALLGSQQLANAAAALTVLDELRTRLPLSREHIAQGLRAVRLRGRFEVVPEKPEWIFDVAHNPQAAAVLAANLRARPCSGRTYAVVGILSDKDIPAVVNALLPVVDEWIAATLPPPRGIDGAQLIARCAEALGSNAARWWVAESVEQACELARSLARAQDRIVVFGSFYTVAPAMRWKAAAGRADEA